MSAETADFSTLGGVGESADEIRRYIRVLAGFEIEFGQFVSALAEYRRDGKERWPTKEYEQRKRAIQKSSVRADRAMRASGLPPLILHNSPAAGGGVRSSDLPSQVFDFQSFSDDDLGLSLQLSILERIPQQIAELELRMEEAERAKPASWWRKAGRWDWLKHPLTVAIAGGVVATVIAGVILALVFGIS